MFRTFLRRTAGDSWARSRKDLQLFLSIIGQSGDGRFGSYGSGASSRLGRDMRCLAVLVFQGTISLSCTLWVGPFLREHGLLGSFQATGGLLIFSVALVILNLKKVALADYMPSLIYAPLISWVWR